MLDYLTGLHILYCKSSLLNAALSFVNFTGSLKSEGAPSDLLLDSKRSMTMLFPFWPLQFFLLGLDSKPSKREKSAFDLHNILVGGLHNPGKAEPGNQSVKSLGGLSLLLHPSNTVYVGPGFPG